MTIPMIDLDLTKRLDDLEQSLPPVQAKSVALCRATVRRTNDVVASVFSDVARRVDRVVSTARTGAATTTGQARSAVERTTKMARTTMNETVGQARAQVGRTADAGTKATVALLDDAATAVDPDAAPRGVAYEEWTKSGLYDRAQELDIDGRSSMNKQQLIKALRAS